MSTIFFFFLLLLLFFFVLFFGISDNTLRGVFDFLTAVHFSFNITTFFLDHGFYAFV